MSEEPIKAKAKLIPGDEKVFACPLCGLEFEKGLPLNIFNMCDPQDGCGEEFRVVVK